LLQGEEFFFFVRDERAVQDEGTEWLGRETGHNGRRNSNPSSGLTARLPNPLQSQTDASPGRGKV
jgi:hypothetical protein